MRLKLPHPRLLLGALLAIFVAVVVLNWTYGRLPATPRARGHFITVEGLRIRYLERAGSGIPVVLIHGLPGTAEDFDYVTARLKGRRTIAIDRPGFGFSTTGYVPFARQIAVIAALIHKLHLGRPIIVGHSYGGTIALGFAERHPGALTGLVLVDAAATCTRSSAFARDEAHLVPVFGLPVIEQIANATFWQLVRTVAAEQVDALAFDPHPVQPAQLHRALALNMKQANLEAWAGEMLAANGVVSSVNRRLRAIRSPAVVIQGEQDRLVEPACGRRLAATLPHARLVMVGGGHMAPYTHPGTVAAAVESFEKHPSTAR